jgi:endonuclease III-like uncharacterized protein
MIVSMEQLSRDCLSKAIKDYNDARQKLEGFDIPILTAKLFEVTGDTTPLREDVTKEELVSAILRRTHLDAIIRAGTRIKTDELFTLTWVEHINNQEVEKTVELQGFHTFSQKVSELRKNPNFVRLVSKINN